MRVLIAAVWVGTAVALAVPPVQGQLVGIPAKMKAKKVIADLVPAYYPESSGPGTGDDENDSPAFLGTPVQRGKCIFDKGKVIIKSGKDAKVQLKNVLCGESPELATPYTGELCAHTKVLSTILGQKTDKKGQVTTTECIPPVGPDTANTISWVSGSLGNLTCSNGKCKGTLPPITTDPCPDVPKVSEVRRFEVFDGPENGNITVFGATIGGCCGPTQTASGDLAMPACIGSTQDVIAEMGYTTGQ